MNTSDAAGRGVDLACVVAHALLNGDQERATQTVNEMTDLEARYAVGYLANMAQEMAVTVARGDRKKAKRALAAALLEGQRRDAVIASASVALEGGDPHE